MQPKQYRRRKKLIKPGIQLRMVFSFVGLSVMGLTLQFLLLGSRLTSAAAGLDGGGGDLAQGVPAMLLEIFALSLAILVPVTFVFGVLLTFRVAGPIYRFEKYLRAVASGEQIGPCKIRKGDELQPLCDAINEATEPLRMRRPAPQAEEAQAPLAEAG
jgi:hypothetical protein